MPKGIKNTKGMKDRKKGGATAQCDGLDRSSTGTLASQHDKWLIYLTQRNYSPKTVELYDTANKSFLRWAEERGVKSPTEVTHRMLESFQRYLYHFRKDNGDPLAISTQRKKLCVLNLYFAHLVKVGYITANPASALEIPRKPKRKLPRALSRVEVAALMSVPDIGDPLGIRDRAMLELVYATGIRRTELTTIDIGELNLTDQTLIIHGKGDRDRIVPVAQKAVEYLTQYLEVTRPRLATDGSEKALFLSGYGTRITPAYVGEWVSKALKSIGIDVYGSMHLLRHSCATHLVENGADIKVVQQLLGHENLETTGIYTQVAISHLKEVYHRTHPSSLKS